MKKYAKVVLISLSVILLGFVFWQVDNRFLNRNVQNKENIQQVSTTLRVNTDGSTPFDISDFVGKTALEATEAKTKLVASGTGVNAFVTSIDGRSADTSKHEFWELIINGSEAQVGAGSYTIQKGDSIIWQIDTF